MKLGIESRISKENENNFNAQWKMSEQLLQGLFDIVKSSSLKRKNHAGSTAHPGLTYTSPKPKSFLGFLGPLLKAVLGGFSSMAGTLLQHVDDENVQKKVEKLKGIATAANQPNSSLLDVLGTVLSGPESYLPGFDIHRATADSDYLKQTISSIFNPTCPTEYKPGKSLPAQFRV